MKRTKRKGKIETAEDLMRYMLATCSIVEHDGNRSFGKTADAVDLICRRLCPGEWCTRTHCANYSTGVAYSCIETRPAVCKLYKQYIEKKQTKRLSNEHI
jgi:hypothetical protein